jgi:hypothetical protein
MIPRIFIARHYFNGFVDLFNFLHLQRDIDFLKLSFHDLHQGNSY